MLCNNSPRLLEGKERILIVSPQNWQGFQVSKHHYAIELARLGNDVYFLNPPQLGGNTRGVEIEILHEAGGIKLVSYTPWFPYSIKFRSRWLFNYAMKIQARKIVRKISEPISLVWDFDNNCTFADLNWFNTRWKIFHPVDQVAENQTHAKNANVVFSIANCILERFVGSKAQKHFIPHGLGSEHETYAMSRLIKLKENNTVAREEDLVLVGYVGNLLARAVDRETLLQLVDRLKDIRFLFFGPCEIEENTPGDLKNWLSEIKNRPNCQFFGLCDQKYILAFADIVSIWLVCYDSEKDINGGANSHKVMEYLATGKVVVSSRLDAFASSNLVVMPDSKSNASFLQLLENVIRDIALFNSVDSQKARIGYALENTYRSHVQRINGILEKVSW